MVISLSAIVAAPPALRVKQIDPCSESEPLSTLQSLLFVSRTTESKQIIKIPHPDPGEPDKILVTSITQT